MEPVELDISRLAVGGRGVARMPEGKVALVSGALVGERVLARVVREHKRYAEARAVEVLRASSLRCEPPCPVYGACGGCGLQHMDYGAQPAAKADWVAESLVRAGIKIPAGITASPRAWQWRNRVRFHIQGKKVGFFAPLSNDLVELENCAIASQGINRILVRLRKQDITSLEWAEIICGDDGAAMVSAEYKYDGEPGREERIALRVLTQGIGVKGFRLLCGDRRPWEPGRRTGLVYYDDRGIKLWAFPGEFCQANWVANKELVGLVCEKAGDGGGSHALDLFAGSGNFSLPLANAGWQVLAVEGSRGAVKAGLYHAGANHLEDDLEFWARDAVGALEQLQSRKRKFELVVLDPPRAGAKGLMPAIAGLEPARVIYVSCHPAALARDAAALAQEGYFPSGLEVVDMFPHTSHVEAVLVMDRG